MSVPTPAQRQIPPSLPAPVAFPRYKPYALTLGDSVKTCAVWLTYHHHARCRILNLVHQMAILTDNEEGPYQRFHW